MKTITEMRTELSAKAAGDARFRSALIADPKGVIAEEYGVNLPETVKIKVHEDSAEAAHLVLSPNPKLSDEELKRVSGAQAIAGGLVTSDAGGLMISDDGGLPNDDYGPVTR